MRGEQRRARPAEGVINDLALPAAVFHHARDELDRLGGWMQIGRHRAVNLKNVILSTVVDEVVSGVWQPAVQDRLVAVMVVGHSDYEMMLDPDQLSAVREAGRGECLNEVDE